MGCMASDNHKQMAVQKGGRNNNTQPGRDHRNAPSDSSN